MLCTACRRLSKTIFWEQRLDQTNAGGYKGRLKSVLVDESLKIKILKSHMAHWTRMDWPTLTDFPRRLELLFRTALRVPPIAAVKFTGTLDSLSCHSRRFFCKECSPEMAGGLAISLQWQNSKLAWWLWIVVFNKLNELKWSRKSLRQIKHGCRTCWTGCCRCAGNNLFQKQSQS